MYHKVALAVSFMSITNTYSCEKTFAIIKPDAVQQGHTAKIIDLIKEHGFTITQQLNTIVSRTQAETLYVDYKNKTWFNMATEFISSGPVVLLVLQKEDAISAWRELLGQSYPSQWGPLRVQFATSHLRNALHGADSPEDAAKEIELFFS